MRRIIVLEFITLDGVMQAPGGPTEDVTGGFKYGGWTVPYFDDLSGQLMGEQMKMPFELLLGKTTYDIFASYWPEHGDNWPGVNDTKKYVVAPEPFATSWNNSTVLSGDIVSAIKQLKSEPGPDLRVYGSGNFVQTLLKHDLLDELWLKLFPIVLGSGKRLFAEGTIPAAFKLIDSKITPSGVIFASYKRAGEVRTGSFE